MTYERNMIFDKHFLSPRKKLEVRDREKLRVRSSEGYGTRCSSKTNHNNKLAGSVEDVTRSFSALNYAMCMDGPKTMTCSYSLSVNSFDLIDCFRCHVSVCKGHLRKSLLSHFNCFEACVSQD